MKKNVVNITILTMIFSFSTISSTIAAPINLKLNGVVQTEKVDMQNKSGYMLLDGKQLSKILNLTYKWDDKTGQLTLSSPSKSAIFTKDSINYNANGTIGYLPVNSVKGGSDLLLPVRTVSEIFDAKVSWDSQKQIISIKTKEEEKKLETANYTINKGGIVIAYNDALSIAISRNSSFTNIIENLELIDKQLDEINNPDSYLYSGAAYVQQGSSMVSPDALKQRLVTVNTLETTSSNMILNETMLKSTTEFMLLSAITNVKTSELDLVAMEESIKNGETNLKNLTMKNQVGMASDVDLKKAKQDLQKSKEMLQATKLSVKKSRINLNELLGYKPDEVVDVPMQPKMVKIEDITESDVHGKISDDLNIQLLKSQVEMRDYELSKNDSSTDANPDSTRLKLMNDLKKAQRDLNDAKDSARESIYSAHNQLQQINESNKSLKMELEKSKDTYNTALANLNVGLITQYEVDMAKSAILRNQIDIDKNIYTFNLLNYSYQKPYLLGGKK